MEARSVFTRRTFLKGAAASMALLAMACQPTTTEVEPEVAPSEDDGVVAAPAEKQRVIYWDWWSMTAGPSGRMFEAFERQLPDVEPDIELELRNIPFGEYFRAFMAAHAAGDVPDVMHSSVNWGRAFYDRDAIIELNPYMEVTPTMSADQFLPGSLFQQMKGAVHYGVPGEGPDHNCIFYNKTYLEEAGLPSDREVLLEWDWNDFLEAAEAVTVRDDAGQITRSGFLVGSPTHHNLAYWAGCVGGSFYREDETGVAFHEDDAAYDGLNWWQELLDKVSQPIGPERQDMEQFIQGTTAMVMGGPWNYATIMEGNPDMEWSAILLPRKPVPNGQISTGIWNNMLVIPSKAQNRDAGWRVLTYWCGLEFMLTRLEIGKWMAPRKDFYETPEYQAAREELPVIDNIPLAPTVGTSIAFIENESISATINPIMQGVMLGEVESQVAVDEMVDECNAILAEAGYA